MSSRVSFIWLEFVIYFGVFHIIRGRPFRGLPQPRLCPCKVRTFQSFRLFEHTSPHASSGIHFKQGSKTPGTSPFGALPPVCATLQELRHVPHWLPVGVLKSLSFDHSYCCCPLLVLSLLVQSFPSPPCSSSQDDGRSPRVDHYCFIFAFSQPYGAISLSPCLWDNNTSHIFSFTCLRLVSNGCYCFVICFHVVICFNSDLPFSFPSCMEAQGWGEFSSTSSPTDILRDCRHCR